MFGDCSQREKMNKYAIAFATFFGLIGVILCHNDPLAFTIEDLHLDDIGVGSEITAKLLVKRAADAIKSKDDNVKDTNWGFSYKTDSHEHAQRGVLVNGELSVIGAYSVNLPDGRIQTTMYVANKYGYQPKVSFQYRKLLQSAIG